MVPQRSRVAEAHLLGDGVHRLVRLPPAAAGPAGSYSLSYDRYALSYDRYAPEPGAAPDTYAEFLLRTSAPSWREPSARQRAAGRPVH
jgi:hypothetical protein